MNLERGSPMVPRSTALTYKVIASFNRQETYVPDLVPFIRMPLVNSLGLEN